MILQTKRLLLRPLTNGDINDFYEIFSGDKVDAFVKKMSYEQVKTYFEKRKQYSPNPFSFAVVLKNNNKMIGTVGIKEKITNIGELSYVFNQKYWNKGYASESVKEILDNAFLNWNFLKIKADCQFDNFSSKRILNKFGFKYICSNNNRISHITNQNVQFDFYELCAHDYQCKKI